VKVAIGGVIGLTCTLEWAGLRPLPPDGLPLILEDRLVPELRPFRIGR
jgi:hypothetical protein